MTSGPRRALPAALILAAAVTLTAAPANAVEASGEQVRDLAERALFDAEALEQLRSIDSVDGRPIDLGAALAGADEIELNARLRSLSQTDQAPIVDGAAARSTARQILADPRFHATEPPRPFKGVLDALGDWLDRNVSQPVARAYRAFVRWVPGHEATVFGLLIAIALTLVVFVVMRLARRRVRAAHLEPDLPRSRSRRDDPKALERRAQEAEAAGDYATAIRLRFVAGLIRLDDAGAIRYGPSLTAGQVRRKLRLQPFDRVSGSFEAVAYGGRTPTIDDVEESKAGWHNVLQGVAA
jgi:hypothetical protein